MTDKSNREPRNNIIEQIRSWLGLENPPPQKAGLPWKAGLNIWYILLFIPSPISLTDSPMVMEPITWTGSGKIGPRTIMLGFNSLINTIFPLREKEFPIVAEV